MLGFAVPCDLGFGGAPPAANVATTLSPGDVVLRAECC